MVMVLFRLLVSEIVSLFSAVLPGTDVGLHLFVRTWAKNILSHSAVGSAA